MIITNEITERRKNLMTTLEAAQVLIKMKELGITMGDVTSFKDHIESKPEIPEMKPEDIVKPISVLDEIDEDDVKYWATPYYDELQAQKELHKQHLKEAEINNVDNR